MSKKITALILFHPEALLLFFQADLSYKYQMYIPGMAILVLLYLWQKLRIKQGW